MSVPFVLEPQNLLALYERFGVQDLPLAAEFPTRPNDGPGQKVQWDVVEYSRDIAAINTRTGAPSEVKPPIRHTVITNAVSVAEKIVLPPDVVKDLRAPGSFAQANGASAVARRVKQLRMRIEKLMALFRCQAIGTAAGNLSFTQPGGVAETVDLGYENSHKTIGTAWDTAATDIIANIETAKELIEQSAGKAATKMLINSTVMAYIRANTAVTNWLSDAAKDELRLTGRLARLCELDIEIINSGYVPDSSGTFTNYIPDDFCAIMAGDTSERSMVECEPVSLKAPDGYKGIWFHTYEDPGIRGSIHIEYEANFLPILTNPDEIVFDADVTA